MIKFLTSIPLDYRNQQKQEYGTYPTQAFYHISFWPSGKDFKSTRTKKVCIIYIERGTFEKREKEERQREAERGRERQRERKRQQQIMNKIEIVAHYTPLSEGKRAN